MRKDAKITKVLILFYSSFKSNRLIYTLEYLFIERLGLNYRIVDTIDQLNNDCQIRINYSHQPIENAWNIFPNPLMNTTEIEAIQQPLSSNLNENIPFPNTRVDFLAYIFYHLSRFEEYTCLNRDQHGRFQAADSCLFSKNNFHAYRFPVVDIILIKVKNLLTEQFGLTQNDFKKENFYIYPTIDIDSVFAYKGRTISRHLAAIAKDFFMFRFNEIFKRISVLSGFRTDPNDNFNLQFEILKKADVKATYFIQVGPYGKFDKNISLNHPEFVAILKKIISEGHQIGIHPSYDSNSDAGKITSEIKLLEKTLGCEITHSRQHFLRFNLPKTYRALINSGIKYEWSMGYAEDFGFRAGTAMPFKWFDLQQNMSTELTIMPFSMMDVTFKQIKKLSPDKCLDETIKLKNWLKNNHLPFVFIFHNESLSGHRGWKAWEKVFEQWTKGE
ncbi:MAG: polysaccharide deacetylase family protein [Bacteroidia bacterium]|nr:polysaccharide deacetylase family protein [Bacteroidia bacterium]